MRCPGCDARVSEHVPVCPSCGADIEPPGPETDALIGQVLGGKYEIVEPLGEGGMGRVYRATQLALGLEVAIKTIRPDYARNREVARRFFREARASSQLRHPNSVNIFDFGESEGTLYLAMELLRGRPLDVVLVEDGPMSPERVVHIATQVLDVLEVAHRLTIVHRDLKPENIVVEDLPGRPDFVKVVDFGIAKITDPLRQGGTRLTRTGMVLGTPAYMAPEQILGEPLDSRADFYSLGVVCYELLSGQTPFSGNIGALLRAHLHDTPPSIAEHRPDVPAALAAAIDRVLDKDRERRPATARELARALAAAIDAADAGTQVGTPATEAARCPRCGTIAGDEARFCQTCGAVLGDGRGDDRFGELRRHLPGGVVDAVAELGAKKKGRKRRELVVAVIDLAVDRRAARGDELRAELDGTIAEIAGRRGAVFERRSDGSATAAFGVDGALADDVERAVRAALEMREAVARRGDASGVHVSLTAAIHQGVAGVLPNRSIEPAGDLIELPARLVAATEPGRVVVSDAVHRRLGSWCRSRRMQQARLRGRAGAVARYEIIGVTGQAARRAPLVAPLVGRAEIIAELVELARGGGVFVDLDGEVGAGKTRVLAALRPTLLRAGVSCLAVRAGSAMIAGVLRALDSAGGLGGSGLRDDQLELLRRFLAGAPLAVATGDRRVAVAAAVRDALAGFSSRRPAALLIDAVERADPAAAELIATLATDTPPALSVVAATRAGHRRPWADRRPPVEVVSRRLEPLAVAHIEAMVASLVAPAELPSWIRSLVSARARGSPLMAMELFGALIDAGAIARDRDGRWRSSPAPVEVPLATSFASLIGQRIDGLDDRPREVIAALAVAAVPLTRVQLAAVVDRSIDGELETLATRELIAFDGEQIRFASDAVGELVADHLGAGDRRRWHEAIARMLEAEGDADAATVGEHFAGAGLWDEAASYLERAATDAEAIGGPALAAPLLARAAGAARHLYTRAPATDSARRLCEIGLRAASAHLAIGDLAALDQLVSGLAAASSDSGKPELGARVDRLRARLALARGDTGRALRGLEDVISTALALRDSQLYAEAHADLGETHEKRGDLDAAADCLVRSLELVQRGSTAEVKRLSLRVLAALARVLLRRGEHQRAGELLGQSIELARELDDPVAEARALGNIAGVHHARGDLAAAIDVANRALEASRRCGDQIGAARQLNNLGTLHGATGDRAAAREHFEAAYRAARRIGWREGMAAAAAGRERVAG